MNHSLLNLMLLSSSATFVMFIIAMFSKDLLSNGWMMALKISTVVNGTLVVLCLLSLISW